MSSSTNANGIFNDRKAIASLMKGYQNLWDKNEMENQTELFRRIVPHEEVEFRGDFESSNLNQFFTLDKIRLGAGFNCNNLFISSKEIPDVIVFSSPKYNVLHPLGEPGRDLGVTENRISHLMITSCAGETHSSDDPITFNELLPSNSEEVDDWKWMGLEDINNDIISGFSVNYYKVINDRVEAIKNAIESMKDKSVLLILGKGRENYQIIGNEKIYHSDVDIIEECIYAN